MLILGDLGIKLQLAVPKVAQSHAGTTFLRPHQQTRHFLSELILSSVEQPPRSEVGPVRVQNLTVNVCLFSTIPIQRSEERRMKAKVKVRVKQVITLSLVTSVCGGFW